jgi:hypothetical protein
MDARPLVIAATAAALAVPAVVLADGIGPHSSFYDQHPHATGPGNDVSINVHRDKGNANLSVSNSCLGTSTANGMQFPNSVGAQNVRVRKGKISFNGNAMLFTSTGQEKVAMQFTATITAKKATGTVTFPKKPCGTIRYTAKLAKRTK